MTGNDKLHTYLGKCFSLAAANRITRSDRCLTLSELLTSNECKSIAVSLHYNIIPPAPVDSSAPQPQALVMNVVLPFACIDRIITFSHILLVEPHPPKQSAKVLCSDIAGINKSCRFQIFF